MIAATHRDRVGMIREQEFREDLFLSLERVPDRDPAPSRTEKRTSHCWSTLLKSRLSRRMKKCIRSIQKIAMEALVNADWPGNIRELENFIERCVILTQGDELNVPCTHLKKSFRIVVSSSSMFRQAERQAIIDDFERPHQV